MKLRNQFLLRIGKAIGSTLAVALLGIGVGNFTQNNETLLVKAPMTGMGQEVYSMTNDNFVAQQEFITPIGVVSKVITYTQSITNLVAELPQGIEMNACYFEGRRLGEILLSNKKPNMPGVHRISIGKNPRGDTIKPNTS